MSARWQSCPHPFHELHAQKKGAGFMSEPTAVDDEWRTRGSSLGADSILNYWSACPLSLLPLHLFLPSLPPQISFFSLAHCYLPSALPSFFFPLLVSSVGWVRRRVSFICEPVFPVCVYISVIWVMLVNPVLSLETDLAHITGCYYCVWSLLCIETVVIYCRASAQLPH